MTITIKNDTTVEELRKLFSGTYPFLKLEFFTLPLLGQQAACFAIPLAHRRKISRIKTGFLRGQIEIEDHQNSTAAEQAFSSLFGLQTQVSRLDGDAWVQTNGSSCFILKEQNETGRKIVLALMNHQDAIGNTTH